MSRSTSPTARVLSNPRRYTDHVVAVRDGEIRTIARIVWAPPADGMAALRVAVYDYGPDGEGTAAVQIGAASGCGYDKSTAALAGLTVGGVELGDHCDHKGRPTLRSAERAHGWTILGGRW